MKIYLVAGGPDYLIPNLHTYDKDDVIWIGVDKGLKYLDEANIKATAAFGDFDSLPNFDVFHKFDTDTIFKYESEKDETDLELAISWAILQKPTQIKIFGATGGRLDHTLVNIQLLTKLLASNIKTEVIDRCNKLYVKEPGFYEIRKDTYSYVSFVPVTSEVKGLSLAGFKYPLCNYTLTIGSTRCISNELIELVGTFSFTSGIVIVIKSLD